MTMTLTLENPSDELIRAFKNMAKVANVKCKVGKSKEPKLKEPQFYTLKNSPAIQKIKKDFEALPQKEQNRLRTELDRELQGFAYGN